MPEQAGGVGRASSDGTLERHAGQRRHASRAAVVLGRSSPAPGRGPPPRQGHQRLHSRREKRCRARGAGAAIRRADSAKDLPRRGAGKTARLGRRGHRRDRPAPGSPPTHGRVEPAGSARRGDSMESARDEPETQPPRVPAENRAHPPDPGSPQAPWPPHCGGQGLRRRSRFPAPTAARLEARHPPSADGSRAGFCRPAAARFSSAPSRKGGVRVDFL